MFAVLKVRTDDKMEDLCFETKEDAERFRDFVLAYMHETGAGNGYGAYWVFDRAIGMYEEPPSSAVKGLNTQRVGFMLMNIERARRGKARAAVFPAEIPQKKDEG